MLFNSMPFVMFFVVLFGVLALVRLRGTISAQAAVLLGASLFFYSMWHPAYLLLLLADVSVNYVLLRSMVRLGMSRACLVASVVFTLGLLGWFKYSAMAIETLLPVLRMGFGFELPIPDFFLPLGISFYSFQILALTIDVRRGVVKEVPSFSRYLLFIAYFPQLIAGPIVRGRELLPQLARGGSFSAAHFRRGTWLVSLGLFKKVVMGDFLLAGFVNEVFAAPEVAGQSIHLIAMYGFAFQIYFDFSGYTDIARGLSAMIGYDLPPNFQEPYLAVNPNDFWRRWHMTLTSWFRDYVFLPLSLSKIARSHLYMNLLLVWTLVGLWHGAAWHFVVWGMYHAAFLALHRFSRPVLARIRPKGRAARYGWSLVRWAVTFNVVAVGLLLFRADSVSDAIEYLSQIVFGRARGGLPPLETIVVMLSLLLHVIERWSRLNQARIRQVLEDSSWGSLLEGAAIGVVIALTLAASGTGGEFIYFQF